MSRSHPEILVSSSKVLFIINRNGGNMIWLNPWHKYSYKLGNKPPNHSRFFQDSFPFLTQCSLKSGTTFIPENAFDFNNLKRVVTPHLHNVHPGLAHVSQSERTIVAGLQDETRTGFYNCCFGVHRFD